MVEYLTYPIVMANNEYGEKGPSKYITYLDANNLYGWAMSQYLPTGKK